MDFLLISGRSAGYNFIMLIRRREAGWMQLYTDELSSGEKMFISQSNSSSLGILSIGRTEFKKNWRRQVNFGWIIPNH